jgi:hypothetical protein
MAEVGAAVEHADGSALTGVAGLPGLGELVRVGVEDAELLQRLEVRALERGRVAVRHVVGLLPLAPGAQLLRRGALVEQRIGDAPRLARLLELDEPDGHDALDAGQLGERLHADAPDDERLAPASWPSRPLRGAPSPRRCPRTWRRGRDLLGRAAADLGLQLVVELGLGGIGLRDDALGIGAPPLGCRRAHQGDDDQDHAGLGAHATRAAPAFGSAARRLGGSAARRTRPQAVHASAR